MNTRTVKKYYATQQRNRALLLALGGHIIAIIVIAIWLLKPLVEQAEDNFVVDFVSPTQQIPGPKKIIQDEPDNKAVESIPNIASQTTSDRISPLSLDMPQPAVTPPPDSTFADLPPSDEAPLSDKSPNVKRGSGTSNKEHTGPGQRSKGSEDGLGNLPQSSGTGEDAFGGGVSDIVNSGGDEFGSSIDEEDGIVRGHISLIRLKHDMSDWWQDPTAITSLTKWLREHVKTISTDMDYEGGALPLTNKKIMEAPLIIMTGHDQTMSVSYQRLAERNSQVSGFSNAERAALRKYIIGHNGMLFFDYCGNGGNEKSFATLVKQNYAQYFLSIH